MSKKRFNDDPVNTEAIETLPKGPKTVGDLQKFLGFSAYYRQSIKNFS